MRWTDSAYRERPQTAADTTTYATRLFPGQPTRIRPQPATTHTTRPSLAPSLCVSLHDVAPATWPACAYLIRALHEVAPVPLTLLVVPHYHHGNSGDGRFRAALDQRLALGDELALHGYFHLDEGPRPRPGRDWLRRRWYTAGEGEFAALDSSAAWLRLEAGLRWFAQRDWPVHGFVAPAWLLSPGSWTALRSLPFRYTTRLRHFHLLSGPTPPSGLDLNGDSGQASVYGAVPATETSPSTASPHHARPDGPPLPHASAQTAHGGLGFDAPDTLHSQSLVYSVRSEWRRRVSRHWNEVVYRKLEQAPLLRLSLHPADAAWPEVVAHWQTLLARALDAGREPLTKLAVANRLTEALAPESLTTRRVDDSAI